MRTSGIWVKRGGVCDEELRERHREIVESVVERGGGGFMQDVARGKRVRIEERGCGVEGGKGDGGAGSPLEQQKRHW